MQEPGVSSIISVSLDAAPGAPHLEIEEAREAAVV
jgi:hypothetical protein